MSLPSHPYMEFSPGTTTRAFTGTKFSKSDSVIMHSALKEVQNDKNGIEAKLPLNHPKKMRHLVRALAKSPTESRYVVY